MEIEEEGEKKRKKKKKDADKLAVKKVSTQDNVILRKTNLFPSMICTVY